MKCVLGCIDLEWAVYLVLLEHNWQYTQLLLCECVNSQQESLQVMPFRTHMYWAS